MIISLGGKDFNDVLRNTLLKTAEEIKKNSVEPKRGGSKL
jgi:hypothetical protein